jgi:hypothetical protein
LPCRRLHVSRDAGGAGREIPLYHVRRQVHQRTVS